MATRKAAKRWVTGGRKTTRPTKRRPIARSGGRGMNEILIELGRQALIEGVKEVLEDHGVDSSIKVDMVLRPAKAKGGRKPPKTRRTTKRRTR